MGAAIDGVVKETIREALPAEELAIAGAVIDEEALAQGLDAAIDEGALKDTVDSTAHDLIERPAD